MREIDHIVQVLKRHWEGDTAPALAHELEALFRQYPFLEKLVADLHDESALRHALRAYGTLFDEAAQADEQRMLQRVITATHPTPAPQLRSRHRIRRYGIAASIAAVCALVFWFVANRPSHTAVQQAAIASLSPGTNKAVLILPDGRRVALSTKHEGIVAGETLTYNDHTPLLDESFDGSATLVMTTPRGGQYRLQLHDGTRVWLNAESRLEYPPVFGGRQREVKLTGEAYFEVATAGTPFIVHTPGEHIKVLGTHFNVNAYADEPTSAVSLLEGKVKVSLPDATSEVLMPGQQAIKKANTLAVQTVDVSESVAWKNGEFMFNNEHLDGVMRKLARWYDIDIEVPPELADIQIWGTLSRSGSFAEALRLIQMTDDEIQFTIAGRSVKLMK